MRRRVFRLLVAVCVCVGLGSPVFAVVTIDAAPTTTVTLDPASPDGLAGWWRSAPSVSVQASQDATIHYAWNAGAESTVAVSAGVPYVTGPAPEGVAVLTAFAVNSSGETETPSVVTAVTTDSQLPDRPSGLAATPEIGPKVTLDWDDASDNGASGLSYYTVYRNLTGPPYSPSDSIGTTTESTFVDSTVSHASYHYAVDAWDAAGNQSLLSDSVSTVTDFDAPSQPQNLRAWKNASGWARVLWEPSVDIGSGVAYYRLERRIDAGPTLLLTTVPAGTTTYNDFDPIVATAGTVRYQVTAVDRAGNWSATAGPVTMQLDSDAPALAGGPTAVPVFAPGLGVTFSVSWEMAADSGSDLHMSLLRYGPDPSSPAALLETDEDKVTLTSDDPSALWYFTLQAEDEAGNLSSISSPALARYVSVERVWGADRLATSRAISSRAFDSASAVVIASSRAFPDALCASSLAGVLNAPILLAGSGPLPAQTLDEIARLGATDAYVIGGSGAVSNETFDSVAQAVSGDVTRICGPTRYETAAEVAQRVQALKGGFAIPTVFVLSGQAFPDALSAGAAAYASGYPILYATDSVVPAITSRTASELGATQSVVVGGTVAVTPTAEDRLASVTRVWGPDRYATSRAFAQWAVGEGMIDLDHSVIATGKNYPDGLSASGLAGQLGCPVLLVSDPQIALSAQWHASRRDTLEFITLCGGSAVVSDSLMTSVWESVSTP